ITVLGSAAAEAWPALFCTCEACREARRRGGRNLRRRTAYRIDCETLIDFGPDIHWQSHAFGIDMADIRRILITHSHSDHLDTVELQWRRKGFSRIGEPLEVFANAHVFDRIARETGLTLDQIAIVGHTLEPGREVVTGPYTVTPLRAQHASPDEAALNFILHDGRVGALIGNDTGWWAEETWQQTAGRRLDAAIIECTYLHKDAQHRQGHLGAEAAVAFRDRLIELEAIRPDARVVVNHFSHNGMTLHEELSDWFAPHGIEVAYDGMTLEL
ncbi:MAG: MBL fold metallo-hydrolase, partial [Lentisphaerae bacterium]|nr:MBL fold metallo-hydrolase [Lentisphaerota bacterium]